MRKFPAIIRTASNKKKTDTVIPSTRKETEYGVYEEDVLFALMPVDTFIIFLYEILAFFSFLMCPGLEVSHGVGKAEDIYVVALNTLYDVCGLLNRMNCLDVGKKHLSRLLLIYTLYVSCGCR